MGNDFRFFADEVKIAGVNEKACALPYDKNGVLPPERVNKQCKPPQHAEIPKGVGNDATACFFGCKPLYKEPHEEKGLADKAYDDPDRFIGEMRKVSKHG